MQKRGLGKGLSALISGAAQDDVGGLSEIPISQIRPNPYQPRTDFAAAKISELADSIREHGIIQPVLLRQLEVESYELIAGERRVRAAKEAGLVAVPAIIKEYANSGMLELALIENVQREDINAIDSAMAYHRLTVEFGLSQETIAKRVGKARSTIANTVRLLSLPEQIIQGLRRGEISEGHARALLQVSPALQTKAYRDIVQQGLSVRETEKIAKENPKTPPRTNLREGQSQPIVERDPHVAAIEEALQAALRTRVRVRFIDGVGRLEIDFYSNEELEGIVERIVGS